MREDSRANLPRAYWVCAYGFPWCGEEAHQHQEPDAGPGRGEPGWRIEDFPARSAAQQVDAQLVAEAGKRCWPQVAGSGALLAASATAAGEPSSCNPHCHSSQKEALLGSHGVPDRLELHSLGQKHCRLFAGKGKVRQTAKPNELELIFLCRAGSGETRRA